MLPLVYTSAAFVVVLTLSVITCHPPQRADGTISFSREEFERLTRSEDFYGYRGSGFIQRGAQLGVSELQIGVVRVTVNTDRRSMKIAGYIVDKATRESLSFCVVAIGRVVYDQDGLPYAIYAKKAVVTGNNGEFEIDADIDPGDSLFGAHMWYMVEVYDIYKLIYPP